MLKISKKDYEKILNHCRQGLPNEACGLLAGNTQGDETTVTEVYLLTNLDASREHFSMDPKTAGCFEGCQSQRGENYRKLSLPPRIPFSSLGRRQTAGV